MNLNEPIIKQSTIDFANKWNVGVDLISQEEYINYTVEAASYSFYASPFGGRWGIKWHKHNSNDRTIVMSNCSYNAEKNADRVVFHELCHAIFEVKPNLIDDIISPLMSLDFSMVIRSGVSNNLGGPDNPGIKYIVGKVGVNSIEEFTEHYKLELIEQGLLTEAGEFTFDRSKVKPKESWFKTN